MKRLKLTFVEEGVSAVAELFEDKTPKTAEAVWNMLETPLENMGIHGKWTGCEISYNIPHERFSGREGFAPPENQTIVPLPGDLIWNAYEPYEWFGTPHPVYDFGIFYARESRILLPGGWRPSNRFGQIVENLDEFAKMCARCQSEGVKNIRLERLE